MSKLTLKERIRLFLNKHPKTLKAIRITYTILFALLIVMTVFFFFLFFSINAKDKVAAESRIIPNEEDMPYYRDIFPYSTVFFAFDMYGAPSYDNDTMYENTWGFGIPFNFSLDLFPNNAEMVGAPINLSNPNFSTGSYTPGSYPMYQYIVYEIEDLRRPFSLLKEDTNNYMSGLTLTLYVIGENIGLDGSVPLSGFNGTWNSLRNYTFANSNERYLLIVARYNGQGGSDSYDNGYADGYDYGYDDGYIQGEDVGYDNGFGDGYATGNADGYIDGYNEAADGKFGFGWLLTTVDAFLEHKFFGDFSVGMLLSIFIGGWLMVLFLRIFAGG